MNHKTIGDVLRHCKVVGRVITLPEFGYDDNLFKSLKMLMYKHGGQYYPSDKNKGFVFRDFDSKSSQTQDLLKKLINENNN